MTTTAKQRCKEELEQLQARFLQDGNPQPVLKSRTALIDSIVQEAYSVALAPVISDGLSLLAVGGYGRRELFPHSDVDLLLLSRRAFDDKPAKNALSEVLRILWDSGLRASHSVRTVEECCSIHEGNFELTVSLLDERLLTGDRTLYANLRERFAKFLSVERRDLTRLLCRMARARHARFHNTIYRLEPDIKETPGGMRDLQTIHWLNCLREQRDQADAQKDPRPEDFLASVRCFLHFRAGRDNNSLHFEAQDEISSAPFSPWHDPADWMRAYYRHASHIFRKTLFELEASESQDRSLLTNFRDWRSRLSNSEFTVSRDLVFLRNPNELERDPELPLRLFRFVARHGVPLARATEQRLISHLMVWSRHFHTHPPQAAFWREFLSLPHSTEALRAMRATGFLAVILPEWERIDHLVVRDFYHQYTVDEHTLVTLDVIAGLSESKEPAEKRFAELIEESSEQLWILRLALLLHDIGKGSGREHSQEAVRLAKGFLERIGADELDAEFVLFLIDKHLVISATLQSRDLADPATAAALTQSVKTVERLRLLTLLTFADVSGVNSTAMTPWRMEQIWRLFRLVHRHLTGELSAESPEDLRKAYTGVTPLLEEFLEGLPGRYLWTHTREQALAHANLYEQAKVTGASIAIERKDGAWHLVIVAADRPFLFASIAGALSSFGLDILKAEAFSNIHGYIADGFVFVDPHRSLDLNPPELERLRSVLKRVSLGQLRAEDLLKHRPVKAPPSRLGAIQSAVTLDNEISPLASVFEVVTQDRPGLLYLLSSAISRANGNIEVVLVDTEAHKAIDVFHVTSGGVKLSGADAEALKGSLLAACT
jgi:[protein-PII] uridylyltransferase